jgi:hypothetical protein
MDILVRLGVQLAAFIIAGSVLMVAITRFGSAENIISIVALTVGLLSMAIAIALHRFGRRGKFPQEER